MFFKLPPVTRSHKLIRRSRGYYSCFTAETITGCGARETVRPLRAPQPVNLALSEAKSYQWNLAVIWSTRGLLLNVLVGLLNNGLLTVT